MINILIIFLCLIGIPIYFFKSDAKTAINSSKWYICIYIFLIVTYLFSGICYYDEVSYYAMGFLTMSSIFFLISEYFGYSTLKVKYTYVVLMPSSLPRIVRIVGIICLIGGVSYIVDVIRLNGINFGFHHEDYKISWVGSIGHFSLCIGLLVWIYSLLIALKSHTNPSFIGWSCLLVYLCRDLVLASRGHFVNAFVVSMIIFFYARKRTQTKFLISNYFRKFIIIITFFSLIFGFMVYISIVRNPIPDKYDPVIITARYFGASVEDETKNMLDKAGIFRPSVMTFLFYYSHLFPNYSVYFNHYDYPPTFGWISFLYITRRFESLIGKNISTEVLDYIDYQFSSNMIMSIHTWGTHHKNLLIDYGKIGATLANIIFGFLIGLARKCAIIRPSPINVLIQALICSCIVLSIHATPFANMGLAFPLYAALLLKPLLKNQGLVRV